MIVITGIVVFGILAGIHLYFIKKYWLNLGTIFMFYWAFVTIMASLRLYGLRETSSKAYLFVLIGIIFFYLGSLFAAKLKFIFRQFKKSNPINCSGKYETNYTFLNIASLIVIVYSVYRIQIILHLLAVGNSWWSIRLMATSGEGGAGTLKGGNLSDIIYSFIVSPLIYLIVPTIVVEILSGRRKRAEITLSVVATALYSISTVSRSVWAFAIIYVITAAILLKKDYILTKRQKKILRCVPFIIFALVLVINKVTKLRNSDADILANAYAYISGCMPLLSIHLQETISEIRTYGMLTFYGFLNPIFFLTNRLHILKYPDAFTNAKFVKDNLEIYFSLSPEIRMNAYATLFYDFYIDFGWMGIAVCSFAFGYICMKAFNIYESKLDTRSMVLYLILLQFILFSVARIYTVYATRALSFVWMIFMFKRVSRQVD